MTFDSILFRDARATDVIDAASEPEIFGDLNLDQIIDSITRGRDDYNLKPFFYVPLTDIASVSYRHDILHDLERDEVVTCINAFAAQMRAMRVQLAAATKLYFRWQKRRYFLDGAQIYCAAIDALARDLEAAVPHSSGLHAFLDYLKAYANGHEFQVTKQEEARIRDALAQVRYSILIKGNAVTVRKYAGEIDYSEDVQKTFEKFKQGKVKSHSTDMRDSPDMDHVKIFAVLTPVFSTPSSSGSTGKSSSTWRISSISRDSKARGCRSATPRCWIHPRKFAASKGLTSRLPKNCAARKPASSAMISISRAANGSSW
jgi:DNA mismatch repair protein MutS